MRQFSFSYNNVIDVLRGPGNMPRSNEKERRNKMPLLLPNCYCLALERTYNYWQLKTKTLGRILPLYRSGVRRT